jgi:hypothetical protein
VPPFFRFVQLEFPWELGPADGRYVLRGHAGAVDHVLVLRTLGAPERRGRLRGRRPQSAPPEPPPEPVATGRATVIAAEPLATEQDAQAWLRDADVEAEAAQALATLNGVLQAHRVATADPFVREVVRDQALVVRVGIGPGDDVADGRWAEAVRLPRPDDRTRSRGSSALRPQERLTALLSGRDVALACEDLLLRTRQDLDAGRIRQAALQLRVAFEAAMAELAPWTGTPLVAERLDGLRAKRHAVGAAANAALEGGLDEETAEDVERITRLLESALRARSAGGFD